MCVNQANVVRTQERVMRYDGMRMRMTNALRLRSFTALGVEQNRVPQSLPYPVKTEPPNHSPHCIVHKHEHLPRVYLPDFFLSPPFFVLGNPRGQPSSLICLRLSEIRVRMCACALRALTRHASPPPNLKFCATGRMYGNSTIR